MNLLRMLRTLVGDMVAVSPRKAAATVILMLVIPAIEGVNLLVLMPLLALVGVGQAENGSGVTAWFNSAFDKIGVTPTLGGVLLLYVGIAAVRALLLRAQSLLNVALREEYTARNRVRVYRAISGAEWKFLVTRRQSEFVHVLAGEIGRVGSAAHHVVNLAISLTLTAVYVGLAVHLSPVMATVLLVCALLTAWFTRDRVKQARALGAQASKIRGRLHSAIAEHIGSMKTAKSYGAAERHTEVFTGLAREMRDVSVETTARESGFQQGLEFGSTALLAVIVYLSFRLLNISAAQLLILLFIFSRLTPRIVTSFRQVQQLAGFLPVVEMVPEFERECRAAAEPPASAEDHAPLAASIHLENVSFTYLRRTDSPAVQNLNLEITAGLTTAIVGSSGAGKSTLADLLIGLLSPSEGRILIDGKELTPERLGGWRHHISYVPQDTFLFHDTVRQNLSWARPGASDQELWHALELAAAADFVSGLPIGLDTIVGERGVLVSGGERQRLSLARALLRRPSVLVLDEATSSLDSETERRIQHAIEGLHHRMTIVIVTHRLSMISGADMIHVLDHGRLVESGTWTDLLNDSTGRFSRLCRAQGIHSRPAPVMPDQKPPASPPRVSSALRATVESGTQGA